MKGIRDMNTLDMALKTGFQQDQQLLLATDMRAMMNPTRMKILAELAHKLSLRIAQSCPACLTPGFGFKTTEGNLPCSLCGSLTTFYHREVWGCIVCSHQVLQPRRDSLIKADPTYCNYCNP
jgi:hypothetical protein